MTDLFDLDDQRVPHTSRTLPVVPDRPRADVAELERRAEIAEHRRDGALSEVERAADEEWKAFAVDFLRRYLEQNPELFGDDLWSAGLPKPREARALGPLFRHAAREGWIEKTGLYRPSSSSNRSPMAVWRSRLYQQGDPS